MPKVDPNRDKKAIDTMVRKITAIAKKHCKQSVVDHGKHGDEYYISVECPPTILDYMEEVVDKSPFATLVKGESHEGHYDWGLDMYIKDCDIVYFKL